MQFVIAHLLHSYFSRLYIFRLDVVYISNDQVLIVYDAYFFTDWHKRYSLHMRWCLYWLGENNLRKVIWYLKSLIYMIIYNALFKGPFWKLIFYSLHQTSRFFHWIWSTSACKYEDRWSDKCCCDVISARIGKFVDYILLGSNRLVWWVRASLNPAHMHKGLNSVHRFGCQVLLQYWCKTTLL